MRVIVWLKSRHISMRAACSHLDSPLGAACSQIDLTGCGLQPVRLLHSALPVCAIHGAIKRQTSLLSLCTTMGQACFEMEDIEEVVYALGKFQKEGRDRAPIHNA